MLTLLTLNIARPSRATAAGILDYLWHRPEPLLVLTEASRGDGSALLSSVCRAAGHDVHTSLAAPRDAAAGRPMRGRQGELGVVVVAREGIEVTPAVDMPVPAVLPERVLALDVATPRGPVLVLAVYGAASDPLRYGSAAQRRRKREWLGACCAWLAAAPPRSCIVAGDLNIVAPGHASRMPYALVEERAAYELLTGPLGFRDVYADLHHGTAAAGEPTWVDHSGVGCRYDYVLTGAGGPSGVGAAIDPAPRERGLSDHNALIVNLS